MCGIAGFWSKDSIKNESSSIIRSMINQIKHRGPDDLGFWESPLDNIYLAHSRLSILDLSKAGHQPMISDSGRYVISFNGEIYNHSDLRVELEKIKNPIHWRGHSDTEALINLIEVYGLERALEKCIGMFALAIWDRQEKCLTLARDRMGEKPLYYGLSGNNQNSAFVFGSELSAIKKWKYFDNEINPLALYELLNFQAISAPNSIYKDILQLEPGHKLTINKPEDILKKSTPWWRLTESIENSLKNPIVNEGEAIEFIENVLKKSIKRQSMADVSVGTFLSGGIDSSLITALLQTQSNNKVKTFTIGFEDNNFNEAPFAKEVAEHLNTQHNEFYLTSKDVQNLIPTISSIYSEPFADLSQLPTHLVCREAHKSGLKVALSGDGGDELFGGYNRYFLGENIWKKINIFHPNIRRLFGEIGIRLPHDELDKIFKNIGINNLGNKVSKLSRRLQYIKNEDDFYYSLISQWPNANFLFQDNFKNNQENYLPQILRSQLPNKLKHNLGAKMMIYDSLNYLPNDILTKIDRASMATSLETRSPFLDHTVIQGAWRIDMGFKIKSKNWKNSSKWVLRKILYNYVPQSLIDRPKSGFGVPMGDWLRGSLKSWANDLLSESNIKNSGILNSEKISMIWEEHISSKYDNSAKLWPILMLQSWLENEK